MDWSVSKYFSFWVPCSGFPELRWPAGSPWNLSASQQSFGAITHEKGLLDLRISTDTVPGLTTSLTSLQLFLEGTHWRFRLPSCHISWSRDPHLAFWGFRLAVLCTSLQFLSRSDWGPAPAVNSFPRAITVYSSYQPTFRKQTVFILREKALKRKHTLKQYRNLYAC